MSELAELAMFREIVAVDTEFTALPGERPVPVCAVAHELRSGRKIRIWLDQFVPVPPGAIGPTPTPPFATGPDVLFVAYYASAELNCFRVLSWPMPERVLDLYTEFRDRTNGRPTPAGRGLLGALTYFGLGAMDATEKHELQEALGNGAWRGRYTPEEILDYCETDVEALERLLPAMLSRIDLPRALLRGRYMAAESAMEHAGTPIDTDMLERLRPGWTEIQDNLIAEIDNNFGVYDGRVFKHDRFERWLTVEGIPWPRLESGRLDLSDDTFRQQARAYPRVAPLRELRHSLSALKLNNIAVGADGRNRTKLWAFGTKTGRNAPSNSEFIFGASVWLRGLIKPPPGYAVAYVDWREQEIGIAAALSGDAALIEAYRSGDVYLGFGKQARIIPDDATKETHGAERQLLKQVVLGIGYGMGPQGLAARIGRSVSTARDLLRAYRETYPVSWRWSDANVDTAMLTGELRTVFGWHVHLDEAPNPRSLRNFPMQANAAEMMRLAACLATERGIEVCAPVHDAFVICAPLERIDEDVAATQAAMVEASRLVLDGFELETEAEIVRWPDRYMDESRGRVMWQRVTGLLAELDREQAA